MIKGKIVNEFLLTIVEGEVPAPKKQGKVGKEFNVVVVSNNYIIVNFEGNDVNYFIPEDEFENIEFFKTKN
jgi:hypothetical protein